MLNVEASYTEATAKVLFHIKATVKCIATPVGATIPLKNFENVQVHTSQPVNRAQPVPVEALEPGTDYWLFCTATSPQGL